MSVRNIFLIASLTSFFAGQIFAQTENVDSDYSSVGGVCSSLPLDICRPAVTASLGDILTGFEENMRDAELEKLVIALVNGLTQESDIQYFLNVAAMLRLISEYFLNAEQADIVLAFADVIADGQSIALAPVSLLASAN